jgi:hypothetical protein
MGREVHVYQAKRHDVEEFSESYGPALEIEAEIVVQNRFLGTWTGGFRVAEVLPDGYRIQRFSDGLLFPDVFPFDQVRCERRDGNRGSHLDRREPGQWIAGPDEVDVQQEWQLVPTEIEDD